MRAQSATLIDRFELAFPLPELPLPAIERYRMVPMQSLDLEVDFEDTAEADALPPSGRFLRARCWSSED